MKLLTKELWARLPPLYGQDVTNPIVHAVFFTPDSNWVWLVTAESARTTGLYDRRNDTVALDEVERVVY